MSIIMPGYPVPRSLWATSGEACTACGKRFSFFTSKENCSCCGRLFCSSCLSAECTLTPMGMPVAICLECFQKIQDWRRSNREQRREAKSASPSPAAGSASPPVNHTAIEAKLTALEGDFARVQESGRQLRGENDSLRALLTAKDTYVAELAAGQKQADAAAEQATHEASQMSQQLRAMTAARADATKDLAEVQAKLSAAEEVNGSVMAKMSALLEANRELKGQTARLQNEAAELRADAAKGAEELSHLRNSVVEASARKSKAMDDITSQLRAVSEENAQLRQGRDDAAAAASKAAAELEKLRESAQSWTEERSAYEEEVKRLQSALDAAQRSVRTLQEQQQQQHTAVDAASTTAAQLTEQQQRIHSLSEQINQMRVAVDILQKEKTEADVNYQKEREARTDLESRVAALSEEATRFGDKEQEWNVLKAHNAKRTLKLEAALERAAREAADSAERHQHATKDMEDAVAAQLADKQHAVDSLTHQLRTTEGTLHALQAEIASTRQEATTLREQLREAAHAGDATLNASLTKAAAELEETRLLLRRKEASEAELRSLLADRQHALEAVQRVQITAAAEAKEEIHALRQQCTAARATYEAERQEWQTSLAELRTAQGLLEKQRDAEAKNGVSNLVPPSDAAAAKSDRRGSRWARPTRVKAVEYLLGNRSYEGIPAVKGLDRWDFDMKAEAARADVPDVLVRTGYQIALDWLLFPNTASLLQWVNLLDTVQANYCANPYHNRVHAASVLQGVYALVLQCPGLVEHMTTMEKRAIVFAAAVHDVRHPGRTEVFLKSTFDATYLRYNGCRVLEQMHTSTAFEMLGHPELDFTQSDMDDAEALHFHSLVADLIAATFMGSHAALMHTWSRPLREGGGGGAYDFTQESDRHTVLAMLLHAVDIGAQARGVDVALKWLDVVEEMYQQGDEEAALGLPVCPGNDRGGDLVKGQLFFMEAFAIPVFDLIHQFFPPVEAPLTNLRALHAYYSDALHETPPRPFPPPVQYDAEAAQVKAVTAAAAERDAAAATREARISKREKTVEQAVQRLRQATAAVAQREAQLTKKETQLAAQLSDVESKSHVLNSTDASMQTEKELLRATNAVVQREEAMQRKAAELEAMTSELEQREAVSSQLSSQLAAIAEQVSRRRQLLRYREAQLRARETGLHDNIVREDRVGVNAFSAELKRSTPSSQHQASLSLHRSAELNKLQSAMEKLTSAMSFI
ncbi:hypothetical protein ABB37_04872 [Leptomonas pyrrhocoris]|uniref:Phosphodiesterase n=1 Tax=Leptomonas pyrrhocoris TaxID=157538 RepID=A0A0M9G297_LEPPY|nr:hypothetical protein ABB37_04872 [Leptomonas pyrrhocoris]KPA80699.1 hypothetical protein ABB37_04872 [Leptomonas pyrrhocoris]|eukprot:XP_015659138.1 hypothetical protein ABB37_04872 [Leptomonas pyrrhocoris]